MSDSNRTAIAFAIETTAGTIATGPYAAINASSVTLASQKNTAEENTIRPDRNQRGLIMTSLLPTGGFGFDMIYGNFDGLLFGMFGQTAYSTAVSLSGTAVTIAGSVITATAGTPFSVVVVGQWLAIVISAVKYVVKVTAVGGGGANITVTGATLPSGAQTLTTTKGKFLRNGTTLQTYTIETQQADEATKGFFQYLGMVPNTLAIQAQAEQIVTGTFDFMGMSAPPPTTATVSGGSYTAAVTNDSFAGLSGNITPIFLGSTLIDATQVAIKGLNFSYTNNVRRDAGINVARMGWGQATVTGQISTFFKGGLAAVDAYFTHADLALSYGMVDPQGNIAIFTVPRTKLSNFNKQVGGKNQPVMGDLDFTAVLDPVTLCSIQYDVLQ